MRRRWFLLCIALLLKIVTPQPVQEKENVVDQSTDRKCCPCPDEPSGALPGDGQLQSAGQDDQLASATAPKGRSALGVDGCSSQFRDADSVGAPSILFPSTMRAGRPFVSLEDEKEDVKPLLHPEVDLASSVVNTLREATDEEYRDALERDAARSASNFNDVGEKNAKSLINVFMNPKEVFADSDNTSKAPNIEETNPTNLLTDLLKLTLPKPESLKKLFDMDNNAGASNINERRIASTPPNNGADFIAKLNPLNIFSKEKSLETADVNLQKLTDISDYSRSNDKSNPGIFKSAFDTYGRTKPYAFPTIMDLIPKKDVRRILNSDSKFSPSKVEERYHYPESNINLDQSPDNLMSKFNNMKLPQHKARDPNENLRDNAVHRKKLLQIPSSKNRDAASDLLKDVLRGLEESRKRLNLPDLLNLRNNFQEKKTSEKNNKQLDKMQTEIIETTDSNVSNSIKEPNTNLSDWNHIPEVIKYTEQINPSNAHKKSMINSQKKTKILTHIPTSNTENDDDELVDNIDQGNEVEYSDGNNLSQTNEDAIPNTSNDYPNYALLPEKSDSTGFEISNSGEIVEQLMIPQVKSASIDGNELKPRNNILRFGENFLSGLDTLRIPEIPRLIKTKSNDAQNLQDSSDQLSIDDLQQMSNSLLNKEKPFIGSLSKHKNNKLHENSKMISTAENIRSAVAKTSANNKAYHTARNKENDCFSDVTLSRNADNAVNTKINDMDSEASEHLSNIFNNLKSPQIFQPQSLFDGIENPFDSLNNNLADIFNNPAPLIPNILSPNEDVISRIEEGLSSLASTSNFKSALPSLQSLDNINFPNLNSFTSELALPKSLDLTHVILEPSSMNSLIGNRRASDFFGNPISLPGIDDLSENFLENAQNLLSTPLETTGRNVIEDTLRSGQVLSENFKVQAKNAVNNLQKHIEGSLKEVGISRMPDLENPLTIGANMIEDIKTRREDFGDKLKGIHYDLTDRLETLRNNILDHLPDFDPSIIGESSNIETIREPFTLPDIVDLARAQKTQTSGKFGSPRTVTLLPSSSIFSPQFNDRLKVIPSDLVNLKSSKVLGPTPMSKNSDKPLLNIFPKSQIRPLYVKLQSAGKPTSAKTPPVLKDKYKPVNSKRPSKFKSSPRDSKLQKSNIPLTLPALNIFSEPRNSPDSLIKTQKSASKTSNRLKPLMPKITASSERKSSTLEKPLRKTQDFRSGNDGVISPTSISEHVMLPLARSGILKTALPKSHLSKFSWPKAVDHTFLNKVRDTVNERLSNLAPDAALPERKLGKTLDMARSATENVDVVESNSELMKENIPYNCKMVCRQM